MKYIQVKKSGVTTGAKMDIRSIENAENNKKDVAKWVQNVDDLHRGRPAASVAYSKQMPDFDLLMEEWNPKLEDALNHIEFPSHEIAMNTDDYARLIALMLDVPVHKSGTNKGIIEALHLIFTLYTEFKQNIHF
jgi:intraflagellar transport protein 46